MRTYERDYRYLLLHLLPRHRLPADVRADVGEALRHGGTPKLRRQSLRALEALCADDIFRRTEAQREGDDYRVVYERPGGRFRVSLVVPESEWAELGEMGDRATIPSDPQTERAPAVPTLPARLAPDPALPGPRESQTGRFPAAPTSLQPAAASPDGVLTDIIRSFAITDRLDPLVSRLDPLLGTVERWLELSGATLDLVGETHSAGADTPRVRTVTENELREQAETRDVIESGAPHFLDAGPGGSLIGVAPVYVGGRIGGVLRLNFRDSADPRGLASRMSMVSGLVRQVLEFHRRVSDMTTVDALTGLFNRQFYESQVPVEMERAKRSGSALTMLVLDIDDFKRINDELGHRKGDDALAAVAELIRGNLRKIDLAFRYGGEEFVVLLPGARENEAVHTAERLRRVMAAYQGLHDAHGNVRALTISVGAAVYPDTARSAEQLFENADLAMYEAKKKGKNRVVFFQEGYEATDG